MAIAIKYGERKPKNQKDNIFSYRWVISYKDLGLSKSEVYYTVSKGANAFKAVTYRFSKEYPSTDYYRITCD